MGQLSKQELHTVFGTSNTDDAIVKLLEAGTLQAGSTCMRSHAQRSVATTTAAATRATRRRTSPPRATTWVVARQIVQVEWQNYIPLGPGAARGSGVCE